MEVLVSLPDDETDELIFAFSILEKRTYHAPELPRVSVIFQSGGRRTEQQRPDQTAENKWCRRH